MGTTKAQARDCVLAPLLTKKSKMADAPVERLSPKHPDWLWLQSPAEQLMAERSVQFDPKTECWIADPDEVYIRGKITSAGDTCEVQTDKGSVQLPKAEVLECNPPKFEKEEDMSNLSILNKACVLHNLRTRYKVLQIYTYSGLFCICINPYKWLMVYTPIMRAHYRNRRRTDAPPHLYAVADGALQLLEMECKHQSSLITGESGAGKTENTYLEKMMGKHLGKHRSFGKPKPAKKGKPEAHFEVHHYAGTVGYNVTGWLFKNKDPVNEAVIGMMAQAGNPVCALVFTEKDTGEKKKGSSMMTISAAHRESLMKLMTNLHSTHPHFVRCIIPNEIKKSGHIDAPLVMHQLNCNGVLEGIRICMLGLPNKVPHADFMTRYSIVAPKIFSDLAGNAKECAQKALVEAGMDPDSFRSGVTKIMFRAGMLSQLEEIREGALAKIFVKMQCQARRVLVHVKYASKIAEKKGLASIQRNIRIYYSCKDWGWYQFYTMMKAEMGTFKKKQEEEARAAQMAEGLAKFEAILGQAKGEREVAQANNDAIKAKAVALRAEMEHLAGYAGDMADQIKAAEAGADNAAKALAQITEHIEKEKADL